MPVNYTTRRKVLTRDGNQCIRCGATTHLTIDHVIPRAHGGTNQTENLQTLCRDCNTKKGSFLDLSWWQRIRRIWNTPELFELLRNNLGGQFSIVQSRVDKFFAENTKDSFDLRLKQVEDSVRKSAETTKTTNRQQVKEIVDELVARPEIQRLFDRLAALEDYLDIEYADTAVEVTKYETVKKYVPRSEDK